MTPARDDEDQAVSTAHDEAFAFGLLNDAIDALSAIAHGNDTVPVAAVHHRPHAA
ncbi:hypothetical protein [Mycobacterium sherrisii]|uniref:hypothetical protein n=1 Tax=Mycobacterium sherrisii TaxID=243061 RepID=UPI0018DC5858|nr:hypothetical protein [Mycobacterium sherrisii]